MARSLPENTVDAWTAIELARAGATWIWLPTTNQGASWTGSHPADVSAILGRRLVLIENKGVEEQRLVDFGDKAKSQRAFLQLVEEAGLQLAAANGECPPLGWVFYGLPLRYGPAFGTDWRTFPDWHHLVCPHTLNRAGARRTEELSSLQDIAQSTACLHTAFPRRRYLPAQTITLANLPYTTRLGLAGLPLATEKDRLFHQARQLVDDAREANQQSGDRNEPAMQGLNGDNVFELLHELAAIAGGRALDLLLGIV